MAECVETVMSQQLTELQEKRGKLLQQRNELRETINNGEYLKSKLRETRKDAKYLSKEKSKLQTLADIGSFVDRNEVEFIAMHCNPYALYASLDRDV